jgi:hypothetical protein
MQNDILSKLAGEASISLYDSIVKGEPFAKMARKNIDAGIEIGRARFSDSAFVEAVNGKRTAFPLPKWLTAPEDPLDVTALGGRLTVEALGLLFKGQIETLCRTLVIGGAAIGIAYQRALLSDDVAEELLQRAIAEQAENGEASEETAIAFFARMKTGGMQTEQEVYYLRRFLVEEEIKVPASAQQDMRAVVKTFQSIITG